MGGKRKYNKFAQRKREKKNPQNRDNQERTKTNYEDIIRENSDFEAYYKGQKICTEEEWPVFLKTIKENLPTAFRITGSRSEANTLLKIVKGEFFKDLFKQDKEKDENVEEQKPYCLPWYPDGLAWQLQLTRKDIRRSETYFRLHNFLIAETNSGNISRQETVSMIPPIVLDVQPHHKVLDMCAAPGSKTAQLIELLHSAPDNKMPDGFVVANDIDNNRCYMLVHQAKRLNSPCIVITNHDSAVMPNLIVTGKDGKKDVLKFDRILCDVPCSGDGTLRKNPDIWMKWNAANGNNLHGIQFRILRRGVELLNTGGRIVYSTCSLNPVENEAVIHRLLIEAKDSVRLVDPRETLTGLKNSPGMEYWRPGTRDLSFYEKFEDVPEKWHTVVRPQMFPPSEEDRSKFNLNKCIRILPHQQDTGAFFVAVLEKVKPLPWEGTSSTNNKFENGEKSTQETKTEEKSKAPEPQRKKRRIGGYREDPFVFFKDDTEDVWPSIRDFYSVSSDFDPKCLLTRCHVGKKKNIYFCSPAVKDLIINNESKIKVINTGVKTFVRCDNKNMKCAFRLAQEGLHSVLPFIGNERMIKVTKEDLTTMLLNDNPLEPPDVTTLSKSTQEQVQNISTGSCVLIYEDKETELNLTMVGWNGTRSLRAYVAQPDTIHMLRLLGGDLSKYDINKYKKNTEEELTTENVEGPENIDIVEESKDIDEINNETS